MSLLPLAAGGLSSRAAWVGVLASLIFIGFVIELIRQHRLQERYSVLWLVTGLGMLFGSLFNETLDDIAGVVGIKDPRFAIVLLLLLFVMALLLHLTTVISRLKEENTRLGQELRDRARGHGRRPARARAGRAARARLTLSGAARWSRPRAGRRAGPRWMT